MLALLWNGRLCRLEVCSEYKQHQNVLHSPFPLGNWAPHPNSSMLSLSVKKNNPKCSISKCNLRHFVQTPSWQQIQGKKKHWSPNFLRIPFTIPRFDGEETKAHQSVYLQQHTNKAVWIYNMNRTLKCPKGTHQYLNSAQAFSHPHSLNCVYILFYSSSLVAHHSNYFLLWINSFLFY